MLGTNAAAAAFGFMETPPPVCDACKGSLMLASVIARFGHTPEIRIFACTQCNRYAVYAVDQEKLRKW